MGALSASSAEPAAAKEMLAMESEVQQMRREAWALLFFSCFFFGGGCDYILGEEGCFSFFFFGGGGVR